MACEAEKAALAAIQQKLTVIENVIAHTPAPERAAAQNAAAAQIRLLGEQQEEASAALQACLAALQPQRVAGPQPREILQINFTTPNFGGNGTGNDWATAIAGGEFPKHQGFEWKQVMDTNDEYDLTPAGASGWASYYQELASNDTIGLHPFGVDWEFALVLDPDYLNLVSFGNTALNSGNTATPDGPKILVDLPPLGIPAADIQNAVKFGLFGVEWDNQLVPIGFKNEFHEGDRVAVFGRWIVDTGHPDCHTEIHPPLLLASACVYRAPSGAEFTRALITSRPYLVGQLFAKGTSTEDIYNDDSADDGHFLGHLINEVAKAEIPVPIFGSLQVEAHPKIKQFPFKGVHLFEMIVSAPPPATISPVRQQLANQRLVVSFHFTHRAGCSVQVVPNDANSIKVLFVMNDTGYTPPALPTRNDVTYSLSQLKDAIGPSDLDDALGLGAAILNILSDPAGALVLSRGLVTDQYATLDPVDFTRTNLTGTAVNVSGTSIPAGVGITQDDTQPFPITGWIEVSHAAAQEVVAQSPVNSSTSEPKTGTSIFPTAAVSSRT
jgi:hypothetical protein